MPSFSGWLSLTKMLLTVAPDLSEDSIKKIRRPSDDSLNTPGRTRPNSFLSETCLRYLRLSPCAQGTSSCVSAPTTSMMGIEKNSTGRIQAVKGWPALNQTVISESRYQRDSVSRIAIKQASDNRIGRKLKMAKPSNGPTAAADTLPIVASFSRRTKNVVNRITSKATEMATAFWTNSRRMARAKIMIGESASKRCGLYRVRNFDEKQCRRG